MAGRRLNPEISVVVNLRHEPPTPAQAAALRRLYNRLFAEVATEEPAPHSGTEPANPTSDREER